VISCSVSVSDERIASAVKAILSLCGIGSENGSILITDSEDADVSSYSGAVILSQARTVPEERDGVKLLQLPLDYAGLVDALNALDSENAGSAPVHPKAEEQMRPGIHDGMIQWQGKSVQLTGRELALFEYLCSARGRIVPRSELMNAVWNEAGGETNVADVYVSYLRKKLVPLFGQGVLVSVRGQGYLLNLPE